MRVGDKKQAGILGGVAVAAVGFLIFQLVPKADAHQPIAVAKPPVDSGVTSPASAPIAPVPASGAGVPLQRDPFAVAPRAKPTLSVNRDQDESAEVRASAGDPTLLPPAQVDALPRFASSQSSSGEEPSSDVGSKHPVKGSKPKHPGEKALDSPVTPAKTSVELLGVVEMPTPVAMIRVGAIERTLRVGDEIVPGLRIAAITLEGITFLNRPGVRLAPGEETNL